jgi:DNA polymerase-3 subunit delta'
MSALWPWLHEPLLQALRQLHSHAVLLHGPEGVGQFEFSMSLSRAWLCEQATGQGERRSGTLQPACGQCVSCRLMDAGSHPDFHLVLPEALQASLGLGGRDVGADDGDADKGGGKSRKPSQEIKVDAIRAVVQFSQSTASRERAKVVLVHPVERMNLVAANTLLKTLEEPPGQVRFVLSGSALEQLLPTVRSRCQAWRLSLPETDVAVRWLAAQGAPGAAQAEWAPSDAALAEARVLLAAAGGQPLSARDRLAQGLDAQSWSSLPRALAQGQSGALPQWPLAWTVESLQKLCHDLARLAVGAAPRYFPADCLPPPPELARLQQWSQELARLSRHADHPWNLPLKVEALVMQASAVMRIKITRESPQA